MWNEPMQTCTADAEPDGGGGDPMSLAEDPSTGAMAAAIADHLADEDARHGELLDWLEEHGFGSTPQNRIPPEVYARARLELGHPPPRAAAAPAVKTFTPEPPATSPAPPAAPTKETTMARTCGNCGSKDHDRRTCPETSKAPKLPAPPKVEAEKKRRGPRLVVRDLDVDELLERRTELLDELADVEKLLADQVEVQEAKLRRMREAITARAREAAAAG